jgi:hypothetical protein
MKKLLTVALVGATTLLAVQPATAGASTTAGMPVLAEHGGTAAAATDANPLVKKKKGWKYKSFQATSCWLGGRPFSQKPNVFFGTPNGVRCAVAYVTVSGVVAYNGKQAWGKSINASGGGIGGALKGGASVKTTWKGYVNNGAKKSLAGSGKYIQLGANFQVDLVYRNFNSFMRINVYPNGKARLVGYLG